MFPKLTRSSIFADLSDEELALLEEKAIIRQFKKNHIVVSQGDASHNFFIVLEGRMRVYLENSEGNEIILNNALGPGDAFGELAIIADTPRSANVMAMDDVKVAAFTKADFMHFIADPQIAAKVVKSLVGLVHKLTDEVGNLAQNSVYSRVVRVLMQNSTEEGPVRVTERLTHQEIANMVGASREMVSKILKDLKTGGYISVESKRITVERNLPARW